MASWMTQRTSNRVQNARYDSIWLTAAQPLPTQCGCARMRSVRLTNGSCNPTPKSFVYVRPLLRKNRIPSRVNTLRPSENYGRPRTDFYKFEIWTDTSCLRDGGTHFEGGASNHGLAITSEEDFATSILKPKHLVIVRAFDSESLVRFIPSLAQLADRGMRDVATQFVDFAHHDLHVLRHRFVNQGMFRLRRHIRGPRVYHRECDLFLADMHLDLKHYGVIHVNVIGPHFLVTHRSAVDTVQGSLDFGHSLGIDCTCFTLPIVS
jgi:hypothetical protein